MNRTIKSIPRNVIRNTDSIAISPKIREARGITSGFSYFREVPTPAAMFYLACQPLPKLHSKPNGTADIVAHSHLRFHQRCHLADTSEVWHTLYPAFCWRKSLADNLDISKKKEPH
jgi:hypothetical protein